jgi:phospholipid transport system substrate-binding protein
MGTRRLLTGLSLILLISLSSLQKAEAAGAPEPASYITNLGNQVLDLFKDTRRADRERERQFRQIADNAFDIPKIARFILGRYWATASEVERQQFINAFEEYMVRVYWSYFSQYHAESITVLAQRDLGASGVRITTQIIRPAGKGPVKVDWTITAQGDTYKIIDVSIEGVSQALTYREEFSTIMSRNSAGGLSALTDELRRKVGS